MSSRALRVSPLGAAAALLHLGLLAYTVWRILSEGDPQWPRHWMLFLALDFPLSLGTMPVTWLVPPAPEGPLSDVSNFWWPVSYHTLIGTPWWYVVGAYIQSRFRRPPAAGE